VNILTLGIGPSITLTGFVLVGLTTTGPVEVPGGTICADTVEIFAEDFESGNPLATLGAVDYSGGTSNFGAENTNGAGLNGTTWGLQAAAFGAGDYPEVGWDLGSPGFDATRFGWVEFYTDFSRLQEFGWTLVAATAGNYASAASPIFDLYVGTEGAQRKFWLYSGYEFPTVLGERTNLFSANTETHVKVCFRQSTYTAGTPNADGEFYLWINGSLVWAQTGLILAPGGESDAVEITRIYANPPGRLDELRVGYGDDVEVETPTPPNPGGTVPVAVEPAVADLPTGVLRLFFTLETSGGLVASAETGLRDPVSYHGGFKPGRLVSVSPIERELVWDGEFRPVEVRVVVADADRTFRGLSASEALSTAYAALYVVEDEVRYALGEPYRIFGGRVASHGALPGLLYEFVLRDVLSERIAELDAAPKVPPDRLTVDIFPGLDAALEGRAVPIVLGEVVDSEEDTPQGVVPPLIVGDVNFQHFGGINQNTIACIWSAGAVAANGVWEVFYNPPDTPDQRVAIPLSAYGTDVWTPGRPGWAETGLATDYADYPLPSSAATRRYTPFFVNADHPLAPAFREGRVLVAGNIYGLAENGDGTGLYLSDPSRIWQWLIVNQLFTPYRTGAYASIPTLDGTYSIINTDSVERVVTRQNDRLLGGYPVGFVLGRGGQQQTLRHILAELCRGSDMEQGIDRHGRLMVDTDVPVADFSDLHDIEDGSFQVKVDRGQFYNVIEHQYGYRYTPPSAPRATPTAGDPLPKREAPYSEWVSGLVTVAHTASITANNGMRKVYQLQNYVVRDPDVADSVEQSLLARAVGPGPAYDGPRVFHLTVPLSRGLEVELGDNIRITHLEGMTGAGYLSSVARVRKVRVDPQAMRVTLEGYVFPS